MALWPRLKQGRAQTQRCAQGEFQTHLLIHRTVV
jgi:hypothetical protein